MKQQIDAGLLPEPHYLYVALGSLGTASGLALGCKLAGLSTGVVGVVVSHRWYATAGRCAAIARRTLKLLREHDSSVPVVEIARSDFHVVRSALGRGYAYPTQEAVQLANEMLETEGLQLDTTYTSKTLHGAMQFIEQGRLQDRVHLFWQTYHATPQREELRSFASRLPDKLQRYLKQE